MSCDIVDLCMRLNSFMCILLFALNVLPMLTSLNDILEILLTMRLFNCFTFINSRCGATIYRCKDRGRCSNFRFCEENDG